MAVDVKNERLKIAVRRARWGWWWTVVQYQDADPRRCPSGWRPTRKMAAAAARFHRERMWKTDRRVQQSQTWEEVT